MMNCNCFSDWDHSLLVFNLVYGSNFNLWMNCHFFMRSFMMIYCCYSKDHDAPCPYFFLSTPLSLNMWSWLSISAFAWGQARSKLGGVDTSNLHHDFLLIIIMFLIIISLYGTILMPFLSYFARFTWRGRMPAAGILDLKGVKQRLLFCTTPNDLKIYEELFWNI